MNQQITLVYNVDETYFITISRQHLRTYMESANALRLHEEGQMFNHAFTSTKHGIQMKYKMNIARNDSEEIVVNMYFHAIKEELDEEELDEEEEPAEKRHKQFDDSSFYFLPISTKVRAYVDQVR